VGGDRVSAADAGPPVTAAQLAAAAARLGVTFPPAYAAMLLNVNGGRPDPDYLPIPDFDPEDAVPLIGFVMVGKPRNDDTRFDLVPDTLYFRRELGLPADRLLLATVDGGAEDILVSARPGDFGAVYHWPHHEGGYDDDRLTRVAASIPEFLSLLVPCPNR
jgi:hypothetical protein